MYKKHIVLVPIQVIEPIQKEDEDMSRKMKETKTCGGCKHVFTDICKRCSRMKRRDLFEESEEHYIEIPITKECPHCGLRKCVTICWDKAYVLCLSCGSKTDLFDTENMARTAWNKGEVHEHIK